MERPSAHSWHGTHSCSEGFALDERPKMFDSWRNDVWRLVAGLLWLLLVSFKLSSGEAGRLKNRTEPELKNRLDAPREYWRLLLARLPARERDAALEFVEAAPVAPGAGVGWCRGASIMQANKTIRSSTN